MTHREERTSQVGALACVEGEGVMYVRSRRGTVEQVRLEIYEPPRFFEAFLRGRACTELPGIAARVFGICPVAYQLSACKAIEDACGVMVGGQLAELRRLLYCGEWIESHALHIYLLHAPDFLGYPSANELAGDHRPLVERGLALRRAGNSIMETVGGRSIHPGNVRVGGFYRAPARAELTALRERLGHALHLAVETVQWVAGFEFPDFHCGHEQLALSHPGRYPIEDGTIKTDGGLTFTAAAFEDHVIEEQVPDSTAMHARLAGRGAYLTGPQARYSVNWSLLSPLAQQVAREAGLGPTSDNPFRSVIVRAVETVYAIEEAMRLIDAYEPPEQPAVAVPARAGTGYGMTEAPRGVLYHRYKLAADGTVLTVRIVPPTAQNQAAIEGDLRRFVQDRLGLADDQLTHACEQLIRSYDPCISCAARFLELRLDRT